MSTPEVFFRETIDINRYGNAVAEKYVRTYNEIILNAAKQLRSIDQRQVAEITKGGARIIAPQTRKRLRAIIKQSSDSLNTWWARSALDMKKELQGVAQLQSEFIVNELKKVTASGGVPINSVAISEKYADSVIMTDPSEINIFTSKAFTEDNFKQFGSGKFRLTAQQGAMITLPNGQTVQKAFRGIATSSAEKLDLAVRSGVFSGETLDQISRRLIGRLDFDKLQKANVKQIALAGGELTKLANHQIQTIVRTSVNQVTNQASQAVYAANKKVSPKYEYVATLDSRTSAICQRLDGQTFDYNNGPTPPQHFNCRSTTVPIVDFDGLQKKYPNLEKPPATQFDTRPSATGRVPQGTTYGDWLLNQEKELQIKTLGSQGKVNYFKKLARREGSGQKALRKLIRNDGTKRSLEDLERLYGKPSSIKPDIVIKNIEELNKQAAVIRAAEKQASEIRSSKVISTETMDEYLTENKIAKSAQEFVDDSFDNLEALGGRAGANVKKMKDYMKKSGTINQINLLGDRWNYNKAYEKIVVQNKKFFDKANRTTKKTYEMFADNTAYMRKGRLLTKGTVNNFEKANKISGSFREDFQFVFTPAGRGNLGYTSQYCSVVNTSVRPAVGATKVTKVGAKNMRKTAQEVLENSHKNNLRQRGLDFTGDIEQVAWTTGNKTDKAYSWLNTMIHEIGHQIHFKGNGAAPLGNQYKKLGGINFVTRYSMKDPQELFAESFVQYVLNPEGLEKYAPRLYNWVEETVDNALKIVGEL